MITVSPSITTTTLTPAAAVIDGTATTVTPMAATGTTPIEGFSTALNTQINLLVHPTTAGTTLTTPSAARLTATMTAPTLTTIVTPEIAASVTTSAAPPSQQVVVMPENGALIATAKTNAPVATPSSEITMSAADSEILSNVTDTLKFIKSGSKLGDTLPTGQCVQLSTANSATPLTQQSVQAAVQQAVTNTQITTSAMDLAQQTTLVQKPVAQQMVSTEQPVVTAPATQQAAVHVIVQEIVPTQTTPVEVKAAPKNTTQTIAEVVTQTEPSLLAETVTLPVTQNVGIKAKVGDSAKPVIAETKKSENSDAPVIVAQQIPSEIVAPIVTVQAAPVHVETQKASFETVNQTATPDEKQTLTPAKNLLMDAVANRSNNDGENNNSNSGNTHSNPALQTNGLLNPTDNKQSATDSKSFASVLLAEKSDSLGASAPVSDKSAPQNISAAVNKLVQDTKIDVPAMTRPLSHPDWNQELGSRIVWMNNQGVSSAEIKMNPQNMGPITVRIDMNQEQATIAFTAQNNDVRNALEASIPKLREMLNSQNVTLADVNVSQQSSSNTNSDTNRSQQQAAQMAADASANGQGNRQNNSEVDANGNAIRQTNANGEEIAVDEFANGHVLETNGANGLLSVFA